MSRFSSRHAVGVLVMAGSLGLLLVLTTAFTAIAQTDPAAEQDTFDRESILNAATGFFGEGAAGLAGVIEKAFADNGRPNAYILGNEGSAALIIGLRYGDGTMMHKIEGERRIHWTGPSIGFDAGANLSKVFILVYNLYDTDEIFSRFPAVEGSFYYIGGVGLNYQQKGDMVLAPIRFGVGRRAGANLGYMKYSKKKKLIPF